MKNMKVLFVVFFLIFTAFSSQGIFAEELIGESAPVTVSTAHPYEPGIVEEFEVRHEGATFIAVHFTNLLLNDGDYVEIIDGSGVVRQVITNDDPGRKDFWSLIVDDQTVYVRLSAGSNDNKAYGFDITEIGYGTVSLSTGLLFSIESTCGADDKVDIECVSGTLQYERAKSVGRMYYNKSGSWYLCTGSLISAQNHFLSNEHCINSQDIVDTLQVRFNYQYATCNGSTLTSYDTFYGDTFITSDYGYDFSLMTLADNPQATYGFLELDPRPLVLNETVYIPQHPGGQPKMYDSGPVVDVVADGRVANSDFGHRVDTEGGTSGSPVLSMSDHKVIGLHHFAGCTDDGDQNQGVLMSNIYPIISPYLTGGDLNITLHQSKSGANPTYSVGDLLGVWYCIDTPAPQNVLLVRKFVSPNGDFEESDPLYLDEAGTICREMHEERVSANETNGSYYEQVILMDVNTGAVLNSDSINYTISTY